MPAAQASFMAKSTTTPFSMEMNFESWPPISKMVSTGSPPSVSLMWMAPVLCAVISSFTDVGADELRDQLAAGAGGAHAADLQPVAPQPLHFRKPLLHGLDGPPGGAQVDVVDHRADARRSPPRWSKPNRCRCRGKPGWARRPAGGTYCGTRSRSSTTLSIESGAVSCTRSSAFVLAQAVDLAAGCACASPRPPAWPCRWRRTRRNAPGRRSGPSTSPKASRSAARHALVLRHRADQRHRRLPPAGP